MRRVGRDVDGIPSPSGRRLPAEGQLDLPVEDTEHLLEVVAMRGRASARWYVHVDQRVTPGRIAAGQQDGVGVADDAEVLQRLIAIGARRREPASGVVGRDLAR